MSMPLKSNFASSRTLSVSFSPKETSWPTERSEASGHHLVDGEIALGEGLQHRPADIAGRTDHRNSVSHDTLPA